MCCYWWHGRLCGFSRRAHHSLSQFSHNSQNNNCFFSQHRFTPELHKLNTTQIYVLHHMCVYCECVCLLSRMWVLWLVILDFFFICNLVNMWNHSAFTVVKWILPLPVTLYLLQQCGFSFPWSFFVSLLFLFMNFERLQAVFLPWYFTGCVPQFMFVENIRKTNPTTFWVLEKLLRLHIMKSQ